MELKKDKVIEINIDFKFLGVIILVTTILIFTFFQVNAQSVNPPSTNEPQVDMPVNSAEQLPVESQELPTSPGEGYVLSTNGEWILIESLTKTESTNLEGSSLAAIGAGNKHFYLTSATYFANQALTACSAGYHMASLWEILDVSNLTYDTNHPAAYNKADSGFGPPSYWYGWVRTGYDSSSSSTTGTGNCNNWTSISGITYGVAVRLDNSWEVTPGDISTWDATSFTCTILSPVWCVGD